MATGGGSGGSTPRSPSASTHVGSPASGSIFSHGNSNSSNNSSGIKGSIHHTHDTGIVSNAHRQQSGALKVLTVAEWVYPNALTRNPAAFERDAVSECGSGAGAGAGARSGTGTGGVQITKSQMMALKNANISNGLASSPHNFRVE
jgi:hypothetical protein